MNAGDTNFYVPRMILSPEEELFLRQWMFDEVHFEEGQGPAKRLQVAQRVRPAELSQLIAAALPDPAEQQAAVSGATGSDCPTWPWSVQSFQNRLGEAQAILASRQLRIRKYARRTANTLAV
jgi:hypothetical protein